MLEAGFTEDDLKETFTIYGPNTDGCPKCNHGYKGRVGVFEVVRITKEMARIIMEDGNAIDLNTQARAHGFNDLRRSCLMHVRRGVTSLAEMVRVTVD